MNQLKNPESHHDTVPTTQAIQLQKTLLIQPERTTATNYLNEVTEGYSRLFRVFLDNLADRV